MMESHARDLDLIPRDFDLIQNVTSARNATMHCTDCRARGEKPCKHPALENILTL
jgi:hypothetical protein